MLVKTIEEELIKNSNNQQQFSDKILAEFIRADAQTQLAINQLMLNLTGWSMCSLIRMSK